jgi:hypothetical protein
MIEQVREIFELLIAPQFESIRGDIRTIDAKVEGVRREVDSCRRELLAEIRRAESALSTDMVRLEEKVDSQRRELLAEIKAAAK